MSRTNSTLTQARLKEVLHYAPETGVFTRFRKVKHNAKGCVGSTRKDGYIAICVDGTIYSAHKLIFLYMTGEWPQYDCDHINGIRHDNAWNNLRDMPTIHNCQNRRKPQKNSIHKCLGVSFRLNRWTARITIKGITQHLGCFSSKEEASAAYLTAKRRLHPSCTI